MKPKFSVAWRKALDTNGPDWKYYAAEMEYLLVEIERLENPIVVKGYCLKCRKEVQIAKPEAISMKNGKPAIMGECPCCATKIFKIGKLS